VQILPLLSSLHWFAARFCTARALLSARSCPTGRLRLHAVCPVCPMISLSCEIKRGQQSEK
jgi:hypothetical protein